MVVRIPFKYNSLRGLAIAVIAVGIIVFISKLGDSNDANSATKGIDLNKKPVMGNQYLYPGCESLSEDQFWDVMDRRKWQFKRMCRIYQDKNYKFHKKVDWEAFGKLGSEDWDKEFLVSDRLKLLYLKIQKTGTSNTKAYLNHFEALKTNYTYGKLDQHHVPEKTVYPFFTIKSVDEAREKFESYIKIIFLREPLERILSTYSYFAGPNSEHKSFEPILKMLKEVRNLHESTSQISKDILSGKLEPLTLTEYFHFILETNDTLAMDRHWRPQMVNAMPCEVPYDFIGTTKEMTCEMKFLMKRLTGQFPSVVPAARSVPESDKVEKVLSGICPNLVRDVLLKHYQIDYDFLDYPFPKL